MGRKVNKFQKGSVGFLVFSSLKCFEVLFICKPEAFNFFEVLVWPLFALGYPLYASIRAIETNSNHQMRNLLAYWILLSSISLFELAFVKHIGWTPFWPFFKIMAISSLALHRFTGAYYAYKCLVRLFLSVNQLQRVQVINWLNKRKELSIERETFLEVAERYLNENGTESLEELIASKSNIKVPNVAQNDIYAVEPEENVAATDKIQSNGKAPNVAQNDINAVEPEENVAAEHKIVKHVDPNLSQTQHKLGTSTEVKEVTSEATVREYVLPVPPTLRIQKEWTCAVCQVKTTSEGTLNSHLQGRKHKSKCEELKSSKQAMKVKGSSSTASNQEPKKAASGNSPGQNKTQKADEKLKVDVNQKQWKSRKLANAAGGGIRESKYWFDMHNVSCSGEIDMAAHLNGRRHLSMLNEFDDILRVPNYGAMVPQCLNGLPNYGAVVPQGFNGVPNYGAMVPQAFNEVPNSCAMVPRAFNGVPNSGAMVPQSFNGVPNSGAMVPQGFNGVSNYGAMVPQAFKGLEQI